MISRFEFLHIKDKITKLGNKIFSFENDPNSVYQKYDKWIHMNAQEKEEIKTKWDAYYQDCLNSKHGKRYFSCKKYFYTNDIERVKELAKEAKKDTTPFIKTPTSIDPEELIQKMHPYFKTKGELAQLQTQYDEFKGVYEKQEESLI